MIACRPFSFSSTSALVDQPVLVFFTGGRPSLSNRMFPSCWVELILNRSPAKA